MLFRNLTLYRFSPDTANDLRRLPDLLPEHTLREPGPMEMITAGFVPPEGAASDGALIVHQDNGDTSDVMLLGHASTQRLLPASVINQALAQRVQHIADTEGRRIGGRERKRLKEELIYEMLPRAFTKTRTTRVLLDLAGGWAMIDTASRKGADAVISALRDMLGSFPAVPLALEQAPRWLMTEWLASRQLPAGLGLGDEAELRDPASGNGAINRSLRQDLEADEVIEHLRGGKQVFRLGLQFDDRLGFVLDEALVIRKLRFFDVVTDELDHTNAEGADQELAARLALTAGELSRLLAKLEAWFGLPRPADAGQGMGVAA